MWFKEQSMKITPVYKHESIQLLSFHVSQFAEYEGLVQVV